VARPTNKEALAEASEAGFRLLLSEVESIPAGSRGTEFPFVGRDRTIRDVACHLHEWHKLMLGWYDIGMRGVKPDIPAAGFTWRTTPDLNRELWAEHQGTSLETALQLLAQSHQEVHDLILRHTEEELFTKRFYVWTGTTSLGAYLISSTSSHYEWGLTKIKKLGRHLDL
jgi:hypothetical protein